MEAAEAAINKRKYLLNRLFEQDDLPKDTSKEDENLSYSARKRKYYDLFIQYKELNLDEHDKDHILNVNGTRVDCHVGYLDLLRAIIFTVLNKLDLGTLIFAVFGADFACSRTFSARYILITKGSLNFSLLCKELLSVSQSCSALLFVALKFAYECS